MTLKSDAKFEKKLTCGLEIDMKELGKFSSEHSSLKIGTLMELFYLNKETYDLKTYRRVMCQDSEE